MFPEAYSLKDLEIIQNFYFFYPCQDSFIVRKSMTVSRAQSAAVKYLNVIIQGGDLFTCALHFGEKDSILKNVKNKILRMKTLFDIFSYFFLRG